MIAIIDYKMGNLRSVEKALEQVGCEAVITSDINVIKRADKLILPGVGAVKDAMYELKSNGLDKVIIEQVDSGKPLLGICLGMQLLMTCSYEDGKHNCLGLIEGDVVKFSHGLKVPHMGWNDYKVVKPHMIFDGIDNPIAYFVHSYYVQADNKYSGAITNYGIEFSSIVIKDNVIGFQFHPEKSSDEGLKLLQNFAFKV